MTLNTVQIRRVSVSSLGQGSILQWSLFSVAALQNQLVICYKALLAWPGPHPFWKVGPRCVRLLNVRVLFGFGLFEERDLSFLKMIFYMHLFVLEGNNSDSVIVAA